MLFTFLNCTNQSENKASLEISKVIPQKQLPSCEWCGAVDAPKKLSWSTNLAADNEPGERLLLTGTVYQQDGRTPAEGVLIYAYQTNAQGIYEKKGDETGNGKRHGHLRGWVRTNAQGRYQFHTIKPAPYPSRAEAAHVHLTLSTKTIPEYWIKTTMFNDDPLVTSKMKSEDETGQFAHIITLTNNEGLWIGHRDIKLKQQ